MRFPENDLPARKSNLSALLAPLLQARPLLSYMQRTSASPLSFLRCVCPKSLLWPPHSRTPSNASPGGFLQGSNFGGRPDTHPHLGFLRLCGSCQWVSARSISRHAYLQIIAGRYHLDVCSVGLCKGLSRRALRRCAHGIFNVIVSMLFCCRHGDEACICRVMSVVCAGVCCDLRSRM